MSEVIDSYNLVWSSPVCQQEIKSESLFEINNFLFSVKDSNSIPAATTLHPRWNNSYDPAIFGTDRFGLNILPGGYKDIDGQFASIGDGALIWFSDSFGMDEYYVIISSGLSNVSITNGYKSRGLSIRLIRNATTIERLLSDGTIIPNVYTDYDGNHYDGVKIGPQIWTTSYLKVTHYVDGTVIPWNLTGASWTGDTVGATAVYNKTFDFGFIPVDELTTEELMVEAYGRLYNWYAVTNELGLIDPTDGWHAPSSIEFTQLINRLTSTDFGITVDNVGDVLKSIRQVNSPYIPGAYVENVSFLFYKFGGSLSIDFGGDSELVLDMGVNSDKILPVTFEIVEEVIDIDFSLS